MCPLNDLPERGGVLRIRARGVVEHDGCIAGGEAGLHLLNAVSVVEVQRGAHRVPGRNGNGRRRHGRRRKERETRWGHASGSPARGIPWRRAARSPSLRRPDAERRDGISARSGVREQFRHRQKFIPLLPSERLSPDDLRFSRPYSASAIPARRALRRPGRAQGVLVRPDLLHRDRLEPELERRRIGPETPVVFLRRDEQQVPVETPLNCSPHSTQCIV